jgi:hypothetical protein
MAYDTSLFNFYKHSYTPRKEGCLKIYYRCKFCESAMQFHRANTSESFMLVMLNNKHKHRYWEMFEE